MSERLPITGYSLCYDGDVDIPSHIRVGFDDGNEVFTATYVLRDKMDNALGRMDGIVSQIPNTLRLLEDS